MAEKVHRSIGRQVGWGLAFLQNVMDDVVNWGFAQVKTVKLPESEDETPTRKNVKKAVNTLAEFVGEVGTSFYSEYEDMKKRKKAKSS